MRITIQARGFDLTEGLREHTERRLRFALSWSNSDVCTINVCLSDVNKPRGGSDKRCRIRLKLVGAQDVVIEDESDLYVAIERAADRTERTVAHRLERLREHHHDHLSSEASTEASIPPGTGSETNFQTAL